MNHYYKGIRAIWHYTKNCWVISYNGVDYYCEDNELTSTIDELVDD